MLTEDPNVLNDWLVVGHAGKLPPAGSASRFLARLLGEEIELWRDSGGGLRARDRAGAREFAAHERYGYLWVCPGEPRKPLFDFPEYEQPGRRILDCGGIGVATSGLRVIENFLDVGHLAYVHTGILGKEPHTEVTDYKVEINPGTDEIWVTDVRLWQPKAALSAASGLVAKYIYRVMQPFSTMLYKSSPARPGEYDVIGLFVQPLDGENCLAHCLLAYFDDVSEDKDLIAFQQTIFGQDKPILENHHPRLMPLIGRLETSARSDATSVAYRRWLAARGMQFGVYREAV